jgi:hypothetical protein
MRGCGGAARGRAGTTGSGTATVALGAAALLLLFAAVPAAGFIVPSQMPPSTAGMARWTAGKCVLPRRSNRGMRWSCTAVGDEAGAATMTLEEKKKSMLRARKKLDAEVRHPTSRPELPRRTQHRSRPPRMSREPESAPPQRVQMASAGQLPWVGRAAGASKVAPIKTTMAELRASNALPFFNAEQPLAAMDAPAPDLGARAASAAAKVCRGRPPPPPSRTKWTRLVHPSLLTGHVSSLSHRRG